jgi:hypothetical protein
MAHKFLASVGENDTAGMTVEQRHAKFILQIANAPADSRLLDTKRHRRAPKAAPLGGSNNVVQMSQFNGHLLPALLTKSLALRPGLSCF